MRILKKWGLLVGGFGVMMFSSAVMAHMFSFNDPQYKHRSDYLIVSIYDQNSWKIIPLAVFNVNANSSVSYAENNDGPVHVWIRTSMPGGECSDVGCSPHGLQKVDLESGENVICEIKEHVGMFENNLICRKS